MELLIGDTAKLCKYNCVNFNIYFFIPSFSFQSNFISISEFAITLIITSIYNLEYIPQNWCNTLGCCHSISLFTQDRLIDIECQHPLNIIISDGNTITIANSRRIRLSWCDWLELIRKAKFGFSIQSLVVIVLFVIEILFELEIIKLLFFIPVAKFSFCCESITDWIVMHQFYFIIILYNLSIDCICI